MITDNVKVYVIGFACIVSLTALFTLIMGFLCLRKCKNKFCKKKPKGKKKRGDSENT